MVRRSVVIGDDKVEAFFLEFLSWFYSRDAVVNRDKKRSLVGKE